MYTTILRPAGSNMAAPEAYSTGFPPSAIVASSNVVTSYLRIIP